MHTRYITYTGSEWGDLLISYNGHAITYDEIGNPLSYYNGSSYTFTWDGRRLASVEKGLFYATFTYNDEGLRLSTRINGETTTYLYDGSVLMAEYTPNYTCVYIYDESGAIIGVKYISTSAGSSWQTYFFEKNLQGDVIAVYSDIGTKLVSYTYDAWGNVTTTYHNGGASTLAANNPIRYRSYYYDTALQMYYLQSRYYDAKICRFINADSALYHSMLGYNLFAYCGNNPINRFDSTGKCYEDLWDSDGNPLNDGLFDGITGGGGTYYIGPGSAYYNYAVYSRTAVSDALLGGYYVPNLSSGILNTSYYYVYGAISVIDSMATDSYIGQTKSSTNSSNINNYYGRTLPPDGPPNSISNLYFNGDLKQQRIYGPNGKAIFDIDYFHPGQNHNFPHVHFFNWFKTPPRGKSIDLFRK